MPIIRSFSRCALKRVTSRMSFKLLEHVSRLNILLVLEWIYPAIRRKTLTRT